jgi:hypothetical protein
MVLAFNPLSTDGVDHMDAASPNDGPANNYFVINNKRIHYTSCAFWYWQENCGWI